MRQWNGSDFMKERESETHPLIEEGSGVRLAEYIFIPDQEIWRGSLKGCLDYQAYGESFEELRLKLHDLHPDLSDSIPSSVSSNTAWLCWDRQWRISHIPSWG